MSKPEKSVSVVAISIMPMEVAIIDVDGNEVIIEAKLFVPDEIVKPTGTMTEELAKVLLWVGELKVAKMVKDRPVLNDAGEPEIEVLKGQNAVNHVIGNSILRKAFWSAYNAGYIETVAKNSTRSLARFTQAAANPKEANEQNASPLTNPQLKDLVEKAFPPQQA